MKHLFQNGPEEVRTLPSDRFYRELQQIVQRVHGERFQPEYRDILVRLKAGESIDIGGRTFKLEE